MLSLNALPESLPATGPDGASGPCEMVLLDRQRLRGRLQGFHDGDLALDLQVSGRRLPLCVPLRQLQWLRMEDSEPLPEPASAVPVLLSGPAGQPLQGLCSAWRSVRGGAWLALRVGDGPLQRWFVHDLPQVRVEAR